MNPLTVAQRLYAGARKNPDFFAAVRKIVLPRDPGQRIVGIRELGAWARSKDLAEEFNKALPSAKGFAAQLFADREIARHLKSVDHFGTLAPMTAVAANRYHYVAIHLQALLDLKEHHPGLGLGSANFKVAHDGHDLSGLEVAQSIVIIQNFGHLFGTFATERGLLTKIHEDPGVKHEFLNQLPQPIRAWARETIDAANLHRFFYVLAAYRFAHRPDLPAHKTIAKLLTVAARADSDPALERLNWALRRSRQLAYNRMHAFLDIGVTFGAATIRNLVDHLRPNPFLGFQPQDDNNTDLQRLLGAVDTFHCANFFANREAAQIVLKHLRDFRLWWESEATQRLALTERIEALASRPTDWPNGAQRPLKQYLRLYLPAAGGTWLSEVQRWRSEATWSNASFLITPIPDDERLICDIFADGKLEPETLLHLTGLLAVRNAQTWTGDVTSTSRLTWRAVALFGLRLFRDILRQDYVPTLEPAPAKDGHVGYAILASDCAQALAALGKFLPHLTDSGRRAELEALHEIAQRNRPAARGIPRLFFLGRLLVWSRETTKPAAELDGVWVDIAPTGVSWLVMEHKGVRKNNAIEQLGRLRGILRYPCTEPVEQELSSKGRAFTMTVAVPTTTTG